MILRVESDWHSLYYDEDRKLYIKVFKRCPRWRSRVKVFLKLYKTPARSIEYISKTLNQMGIATPEIVDVEDYRIVCKEVFAETLAQYRVKHGKQAFQQELINTLVTMYNAGIISMDPHTANFLCDGEKLIVIDLDMTYYSNFKFLPKQKALYQLWRKFNRDDSFCREVAARWTHRNLLQRGMDVIYTTRSFFVRLLGKGNKREQAFVARMQL